MMSFDLNNLSNFGDLNLIARKFWNWIVGKISAFFAWVHAWPWWANALMWIFIILVTYLIAVWISDNWEEWKARY